MRRCFRLPVLYASTLFVGAALIPAAGCSANAANVSCSVVASHAPSEADQAFLSGNYDNAATLYEKDLQQKPNDPELTAALVRTFIRQEKIDEADALVHKALAQNPNSVVLLTSLGTVQYREGAPWLASDTATAASKIDLCYPQLRLLRARLLHLNSNYASAAREVATAHALDPNDPGIRLQWLETLPMKQRIPQLESYLASNTGGPGSQNNLRDYLGYLKKSDAGPGKQCRMVSKTPTTSVDFIRLMYGANQPRAFGLNVKINDHSARLEIDTGASGLTVSRTVAERAGLTKIEESRIGGVGDKGVVSGYSAYADDIKIGDMEFKDCEVDVIEASSVVGSDGLIGMDVFSSFLVTLDYPMRKLILGPLPARPDDTQGVSPGLQTTSGGGPEGTAGPAADQTATAGAPATSSGLHDRYVAPEMKDWTPVYRVGHNLLLSTSLTDSVRKLFILDTGAFHSSVSPEVARKITKVRSQDNVEVRGISGQVAKVESADEVHFRFGPVPVRSVDVPVFDSPQISRGVGMDLAGFIGFSTLGQMTLKIDYRDALINFSYQENRGYHDPVPQY